MRVIRLHLRVPGIDRQVIDHVAHSASITVRDLEGFDRRDADGRPLSDHDGVRFVLERQVDETEGTGPGVNKGSTRPADTGS